ncbi:YtxH domain-containing protein [Candidatus Peregrinibacteria bacterium]|nr:YtxH domain-containing protein [Candidatus Peregrinibacteria bacterium]
MWKTLKSFVSGIVAGTALGVLFAPKKGEETRKKFKDDVKKGGYGVSTLKETLSSMGKEMGESAQNVYGEVSETEMYKKGAAKLKSAKNRAEKTIRAKAKATVKKVKKKLS